ncbi:MAG: D-alanyl-D-alanine carboxypeptidase [Alphaproteobacteria bacterium]|nr:D-alanyl-D-alanine carboxypeptidase [Alphaproteobacteria bacterium]
MYNILVAISLILAFTTPATAAIDVQARQAYMVDLQTGEVLLEKNADQQMAPSSMSKIMTAHLIFERLKSGDIKLDDLLHVSESAWRMGGSKMFVKINSNVSVEDLLYGVIVQSGNDACLVLAEGVAGTEAAFAEEMTQKAHEMGAKDTSFVNSSGWPAEGHFSTAKDLALMAERTIRDFPKEYEKYYAVKEFEYNNIKQGNRNTLLYKNMGADGVKTGHSDDGGYGSVTSAKQGDRRLILVINGLPTMNARDQEATTLMNWGFNYFKNYKIFGKGDAVDVADVWGGAEKTVQLVAGKEIIRTLPRTQRKDLKVKIIYDAPIAAPLKAGDEVGTIEITFPEKGVEKIPLLVAKDIEQDGFFQRISNSVHYLLYGKHSS